MNASTTLTQRTTFIGAGHGGYEVGAQVIWQNPYGIDTHPGEVVALHRNGNLMIREPEFGTTVDVHHSKVSRDLAKR